ncbi:methyl-accepting chemotaxis protein [Zobellella taiwanensis]|uniref:Methyl-accepting chemotaxis protein n=2 Tax=Zobellella taiwanensis TaxID=347535 RepID=A0A2P7R6N1_9GAMM|nr:methyl-accepting chemotaxis protein [Zobellella taiwanensis]
MMRRLKIAQRSMLAFGLIGLITLVLGMTGIVQFERIGLVVETLSRVRMPAAITVGELRRDFLLTRLYTMNALYADSSQAREAAMARLAELEQNFQADLQEMKDFVESEDGIRLLQAIVDQKAAYDVQQRQLQAYMNQGQMDMARQFRHQGVNELGLEVTESLNQLGRYQQGRADIAAEQADRILSSSTMLMMVAIAVAAIAVVLFALLFSRSLLVPIRQALEATRIIADGNLTTEFGDRARDEMGEMIRALAQMQSQLKKTIFDINDSSSQLASTAEELSVVTDQSTRTLQQQSDELEQAATAVNELTAAVEEVARNAAATAQNSDLADDKAQVGRGKVNHTIDTVAELEREITQTMHGVESLAARVKDIGGVLDVIRAIAEQTNLLALNAAIEAARAGDSGRGFAVVADEVRALAHRTQESTKEIEAMMHAIQSDTSTTVGAIKSSTERTVLTRQIAQEAGEALEQIAAAIVQISEQNQTIASAAEEQATVAREVDKNLVNIRDLSVQTSAGANQTSASSTELARLAEQLNQLVNEFRV